MAPRQDGCGEQAGDVFVLTRWSSALRGGDFALGVGRATITVISSKGSLVLSLGVRFWNHNFSCPHHP